MSETQTENTGSDDSGEGNQSEAIEIVKQQSERIKELEAERDKRISEDAKKQLGGRAEAGSKTEKPKEETNQEYVDKMRKNGWKADG